MIVKIEREFDEKLLENQPWINDYSLLECKYIKMCNIETHQLFNIY